MTRQNDGEPEREGPRCPECKAGLRFSHVEYAGRGNEVAVLRCGSCAAVVRGPARPRQARSAARSSRRSHAPVDEGPPVNPVIDPDTARRLLGGE